MRKDVELLKEFRFDIRPLIQNTKGKVDSYYKHTFSIYHYESNTLKK